jgi:hypothetical protein
VPVNARRFDMRDGNVGHRVPCTGFAGEPREEHAMAYHQDTPSAAHHGRRRALQGLAAVTLAAGSMVAVSAQSATAAPTQVNFTSGGTYKLHVPHGPVTVDFIIIAAGGGADGDAVNSGGYGGGIVGQFTWTGAATTLTITVGKAGGNGGPAGTNSRNGGRGGGYDQSSVFATSLRAHGGNGGSGGATNPDATTFAGGGGGGGGATLVVVNSAVVLVAGGGGGASQFQAGVNGDGNGTVNHLAPGGVGKTGQYTQEGGGGGGGGAIDGVGGGGGLAGGGGTGYAHNAGNFTLNISGKGVSSGLDGGSPGVDGQALFSGVGIS